MSMKRPGVGARDSPTKDRYAGKRQQQSGRGGRRQKSGSRDVSPAPSSWSPLHAVPIHSPALSPHQLALHQQHLTETAAKTPLSELIVQIKRLTFPASCSFVLNLLEKFVKAHLTNDAMLKISLPKKMPLLTLLNYFILCQPVSVKVAGKKAKVEQRPQPYTPMEELQVMVSVVKKMEEQSNTEQQFYMFEALFGGCIGIIKTGARAGETFFERVVSFAVSIQSSPILSCIALWMQVHPSEALSLTHSLYSCFCEHLPNASGPLMQLASLSSQLAQQLALSFTSLFPFHIVGTPASGVDQAHLQPPTILLTILSNWIEKTPQFLYAPLLLEKTDLLSFHGGPGKVSASAASTTCEASTSPLAGLMRWCILAPCYHAPKNKDRKEVKMGPELESVDWQGLPTARREVVSSSEKEVESVGEKETDFQALISKLHANILSVVLSDSQSFPRESLVSDHVAVTVAALLGLSQHQPTQLRKRGRTPVAAATERDDGDGAGGGEKNRELEESVERLAQFLQISLSTGLLVLSSENLSSMASTLPTNKLLTLVISHRR